MSRTSLAIAPLHSMRGQCALEKRRTDMSLVKGRCECLEHKLGQGVPGSGELRHKEVPFGRVVVDRPVTIGIVIRRIHYDVLQGDHLRYGIIRESQSRNLRELSMIDILEQKVSCAAVV